MSDLVNGWQRRILQALEKAPRGMATSGEIASAMGCRPKRTINGHVSQSLKRMLRGGAGPDIPVFRLPPTSEGEPATWGINAAGRRILAEIEEDDELVRICQQRAGEVSIPVELDAL